MSLYRRARLPGASYFFTVTLANRSSSLLVESIDNLRQAYASASRRLPFTTEAICVLPDHLHAIWTLPPGDSDYAQRWSLIKSGFSRTQPTATARSASKIGKREKGIWQRRFWEHCIRDEEDFARHVDYIHHNPVRHGLVMRAVDWPYSSFHRYVARGLLTADWAAGDDSGEFGE